MFLKGGTNMVYLFLANGFEEIEALTQVDYLRRAGVEIVTLGIDGEYITGSKYITVKADMSIKDADMSNVEMLILPGGLGGVDGISNSAKAISMIKEAYEKGIYIAAICAAPTILAELGILSEKKCVCYPSMLDELEKHGGIICPSESVVADGKIITAKAAGCSEEFSFELIKVLKNKETAYAVKESICAR